MLRATQRAKGGQPYQHGSTCTQSVQVETLPDLHVDRNTSSIAQHLANLPLEQFEQVREGTTTMAQAIQEVT